MAILLAMILGVSLIAIICAYIAVKSENTTMKIIPLVICIGALVTNLVLLTNASGLSVVYDMSMNDVNDTYTDIDTNVTYTIPSEMNTLFENQIFVLLAIGGLIFIPLIFIYGFIKVVEFAFNATKKGRG